MSIEGHTRLAIDTAPLIYFLVDDEARAAYVEDVLRQGASRDVSLVVSVVTEAELLVGALRDRDPTAASAVRALIEGPAVIETREASREIAQDAAEIRAASGLGLIDALIAATALAAGCTALLGNDVAFRRLQGIEYLHLDDLIGSER